MKLILEFLDEKDRAEKLMQDFLVFLEGKKLQKVSISIEESTKEIEFNLSEENFKTLAYAAYQLEVPLDKFISKVLEIEASKIKRNYLL